MFILLSVLTFVAFATSQRIVVYNATKLTNYYGLEISSDRTMSQWKISSPGNLVFTPEEDAYLYTLFRCKDYSSYTDIEFTITAPAKAQFTIELQQSNSQCTNRLSGISVNTKEFVTFNGTKKVFTIPFTKFNGLNPKNVWSLVISNFSQNVDHVLHSIAFNNFSYSKTIDSKWSNYCAYKLGTNHYLAECVQTNLNKDNVVNSVSFCHVMSIPQSMSFINWVKGCKPYWSKNGQTGHSDFVKISSVEFDNLMKSGYAYSPQGLGPKNVTALTSTSYLATIATYTTTSLSSGIATLYSTSIQTVSKIVTLPTTSYFNTTIQVPKTIISTKTLTKTIETKTVTYIEAIETITPWPTTISTNTVRNSTTTVYNVMTRAYSNVVSYTTKLTSTFVYLDTYGPIYTSVQ